MSDVKVNADGAGINIFLDGMIPTENLRFREESLTFKISETADELQAPKTRRYTYPNMTKTLGGFKLHVDAGDFSDSEIIVLLGENGMGKTTLVQLLGGKMDPDDKNDRIEMKVSMKPQTSAYLCVAKLNRNSLAKVPRYGADAAAEKDQIDVHA